MSKRSLFWGTATGKLGETVFYRAGGEQRNRTYIANISNPRTFGQTSGRIQWAELALAYRMFGGRLKNAFSNKPANQSDWNAFTQKNKEIVPYVPRTRVPKVAPTVAPYVVSSGIGANLIGGSLSSVQIPPGGTPYTNLQLLNLTPAGAILTTATTWGEVFEELISLNRNVLRQGDKLTLFFFDGINLFSKQYTIDSTSSEPYTYSPPSTSPSLTKGIYLLQNGFAFVDSNMTQSSYMMGAAVITSKDGSGNDYQSNSEFKLNPAATLIYEQFRTEASLSAAVESYGGVADIYLSTNNPPTNPSANV